MFVITNFLPEVCFLDLTQFEFSKNDEIRDQRPVWFLRKHRVFNRVEQIFILIVKLKKLETLALFYLW